MRGMLAFLCLLVGKYGGSVAISTVDAIQPQLWKMLMSRLLTDVNGISDKALNKNVAVGLITLLTETPEMIGA